MITDTGKQIIRTLTDCSRSHGLQRVFDDWVTCCAISLRNAHPLTRVESLESEYLQIVRRYDKDTLSAFSKSLASLINGLDPRPADIMGGIAAEIGALNQQAGQFFTPPELAFLTAKMSISPTTWRKVQRGMKKTIEVSDPACGSGNMLLAVIEASIEHNVSPSCLRLHGVDISRACICMAYVQLSLWGVSAVLIWGNSLSLEHHETWPTLAAIGGLPHYGLMASRGLNT